MLAKYLLSFLLLISLECLYAQSDGTFPKVSLPPNYEGKLNLVYATLDGWEGKLDFYYPIDAQVSTPVVVNIHGGGWNHGQKESQTGFSSFFKRGMAVANIEYRLESQAKAPAAIEDIRCAVRYLIQNSKELNIDTSRIILMGASAGGHLALMAGLLNNSETFDSNCATIPEPVQIFAIIDKYGINDLSSPKVANSGSVKKWLGTKHGDFEFTKSVSPIFYVDPKSPPTFIIHGDMDPIVPYVQSENLHEKLMKVGVKTKFITIKGGKHGKFSKDEKKDIDKEMWLFLEELGIDKIKK